MPSPFPGVDPYLEISGDWRDFHARFLNGCAEALGKHLPRNYVARIEENFRVMEYPEKTQQRRSADFAVARLRPTRTTASASAIATLEPQVIPLVTTIIEEATERWIEVRRRPDWAPVTVIELLSPTNKQGYGISEYLYKRVSLIARSVHLVELDLLLGGRRLPMGRPLDGDYHALVSRTEQRPLSNVYSWSVRDRLPVIPIPLLAPDPDVPLDLATVFKLVYRRGQYERSINYSMPLELLGTRKDRTWAKKLARSRGETDVS